MKFILQGPFEENLYNLMRKISYHYIGGDEEKAEYNFIRPLGGGGGYPRFHIYLKTDGSTHSTNSGQAGSPQGGENLIFNLHLDQKKPIYPVRSPSRQGRDGSRLGRLTSNGVYKGLPAHQGEYDGELVEKEAERIKQILQNKSFHLYRDRDKDGK